MLIDRNVTGKMLVMLVIEKACTTVVRAMVKRDRAAVIKRFVTLQSVQGEDGFSVVEMTMEVKPVFGLKIDKDANYIFRISMYFCITSYENSNVTSVTCLCVYKSINKLIFKCLFMYLETKPIKVKASNILCKYTM